MKIATRNCPWRRIHKGLPLLALFLLLVCSPVGRGWADGPGRLTTTVTVKGDVEHELILSVDDLKRLPVQRGDDFRSRNDADGMSTSPAVVRHYTGCLLRDVLDRAGPIEKHRFDNRKSVIIATASDGYRAVFSWGESLPNRGWRINRLRTRWRAAPRRRGKNRTRFAQGHPRRPAAR